MLVVIDVQHSSWTALYVEGSFAIVLKLTPFPLQRVCIALEMLFGHLVSMFRSAAALDTSKQKVE